MAALALIVALVQVLPGVAELLAWQRGEVLNGAWWQLLSAHLTHFDALHMGANLVGLALLCWLFRGCSSGPWLAAGLCAAVATGIGLLLEPMPLDEYRGLSSVLYGWLLWGLLDPGSRVLPGRRLLAAVLVAWVLVGVFFGRAESWGLPLGIAAHPPAHLYGLCGALVGGWAAVWLRWLSTPRGSRALQ